MKHFVKNELFTQASTLEDAVTKAEKLEPGRANSLIVTLKVRTYSPAVHDWINVEEYYVLDTVHLLNLWNRYF